MKEVVFILVDSQHRMPVYSVLPQSTGRLAHAARQQTACPLFTFAGELSTSWISLARGSPDESWPVFESLCRNPPIEPPNKSEWILSQLIAMIQSIPSLGTLESIVSRCIDLYLEFIFPNQPLIHEPTIRASVAIFSLEIPAPFEVARLRAFTLLTALSTFVASVTPDQLLLSPHYLADKPVSFSLNIRMWHSATLQNTTGKIGASWHSHGEATSIAQRLGLFDEDPLRQIPPVKAQLLRSAFWHLYLAERSAEALGSRPVVLHEVLFAGELTVLEHTEHDQILL
ncbi:hypothetical protein BJX70DRAFT_398861 [Aspergillus crustosus]